jgi:hypothetical protein
MSESNSGSIAEEPKESIFQKKMKQEAYLTRGCGTTKIVKIKIVDTVRNKNSTVWLAHSLQQGELYMHALTLLLLIYLLACYHFSQFWTVVWPQLEKLDWKKVRTVVRNFSILFANC